MPDGSEINWYEQLPRSIPKCHKRSRSWQPDSATFLFRIDIRISNFFIFVFVEIFEMICFRIFVFIISLQRVIFSSVHNLKLFKTYLANWQYIILYHYKSSKMSQNHCQNGFIGQFQIIVWNVFILDQFNNFLKRWHLGENKNAKTWFSKKIFLWHTRMH